MYMYIYIYVYCMQSLTVTAHVTCSKHGPAQVHWLSFSSLSLRWPQRRYMRACVDIPACTQISLHSCGCDCTGVDMVLHRSCVCVICVYR